MTDDKVANLLNVDVSDTDEFDEEEKMICDNLDKVYAYSVLPDNILMWVFDRKNSKM